MSSSVDLRGFVYQLEPIRKRNKWELDAFQQKLALAQKEFSAGQNILNSLKQKYTSKMLVTKSSWHEQLNLVNHQHALFYLQALQRRIENQSMELVTLKEKLDTLRELCLEQQMKLELIDVHRESSVSDYKLEQQNIQSAEADREWNARSLWRQKRENTFL